MNALAQTRECSVPGCDRTGKLKRGWCSKHYGRWLRNGNPNATARPEYGKALCFYSDVVLSYSGDECLIWPFSRDEHGRARLNGKIVSRLVCKEVNGEPPSPDHHAAHSCGKGHLGCVAGNHLAWKTRSENEADKIGHGTVARGERNGQSKLTKADVLEIRSLRGSVSQEKLAARFGVSPALISNIHRGQKWAWLREERHEAA